MPWASSACPSRQPRQRARGADPPHPSEDRRGGCQAEQATAAQRLHAPLQLAPRVRALSRGQIEEDALTMPCRSAPLSRSSGSEPTGLRMTHGGSVGRDEGPVPSRAVDAAARVGHAVYGVSLTRTKMGSELRDTLGGKDAAKGVRCHARTSHQRKLPSEIFAARPRAVSRPKRRSASCSKTVPPFYCEPQRVRKSFQRVRKSFQLDQQSA